MAVGHLGQFIFVVPEKNMVVVFTSNKLENDDFYIPKRMLDQYIIPAAISSRPLAAQPKKNEHLDSLLASFAEAPAQGFIWTSEENGVAKSGEFVHTASPVFRFKYPKTSYRKHPIDYPSAVMVMKKIGGFRFSAGIWEFPVGAKLVGIAQRVASAYEGFGSDIQIISNQRITLEDGTEAYRTDMSWKLKSTRSTRTLLVSASKKGKLVIVRYHFPFAPWDETSTSEYLKEGTFIVESLTFE
jgi:hypothetical protein